jgi:hypothetical protein
MDDRTAKRIGDKILRFLSPRTAKTIDTLQNEVSNNNNNLELLRESLTVLEQEIDSESWMTFSGLENEREFSRSALEKIVNTARLFWLKNPLIRRAINVQADYVFGQGISINSTNEEIQDAVNRFWQDPENRRVMTNQQSLGSLEKELNIQGNIFFALFCSDPTLGNAEVRTIAFTEIQEIICNPDDRQDIWFYKRQFSIGSKQEVRYYRDFYKRNDDVSEMLSELWESNKIDISSVDESIVIYHMKSNYLSDMKFGVSEIYSALEWARQYSTFLKNWQSVVAALASWAMQITVKGGRKELEAVNSSIIGTSVLKPKGGVNPGSVFLSQDSVEMKPLKTSGMTTSADDGRRLMLMVCSATGIFEHYLTGDPSTGNLATATAMERPMELQFRNRQQLWADTITEMLTYVVEQAIKTGKIETLVWDSDSNTYDIKEDSFSKEIDVTFPDILEKDMSVRVDSIIKAATLGTGGRWQGTMPYKKVCELLMKAVGIEKPEELLEQMFPEGTELPSASEVVNKQFQAAGLPSGFPFTAGDTEDEEDTTPQEAIRTIVKEMRETVDRIIAGGNK